MKCENCGGINPAGEKKCQYCGIELDSKIVEVRVPTIKPDADLSPQEEKEARGVLHRILNIIRNVIGWFNVVIGIAGCTMQPYSENIPFGISFILFGASLLPLVYRKPLKKYKEKYPSISFILPIVMFVLIFVVAVIFAS